MSRMCKGKANQLIHILAAAGAFDSLQVGIKADLEKINA